MAESKRTSEIVLDDVLGNGKLTIIDLVPSGLLKPPAYDPLLLHQNDIRAQVAETPVVEAPKKPPEVSAPVLEVPPVSSSFSPSASMLVAGEAPAPEAPLFLPVVRLALAEPKRRGEYPPIPVYLLAVGIGAVTLGTSVAVFAAHQERSSHGYTPNTTPIDRICDRAEPGKWSYISGTNVLQSESVKPQEVAIKVFHGNGKKEPTLLAEAARVPLSCVEDKAPLMVVGHDPMNLDYVELDGIGADGNSIGTGKYHFEMAREVRGNWKDYFEGGRASLHESNKNADWGFVVSGRDTLGCRVQNSGTNPFCAIDVNSTDLPVQTR